MTVAFALGAIPHKISAPGQLHSRRDGSRPLL